MKKSLIILSTLIVGVSPLLTTAQYAQDKEFTTALEWMHSQGLTQYDTSDAFRPGDQLTRQEAAKFFSSVLAFVTLPETNEVTNFACSFEDSNTFDTTLSESIQLACESGLMRGWDNKFHPNQVLTKAEALTILVRMQHGLLDESLNPWWTTYYEQAFANGLTKETQTSKIGLPITRYEAALLINRQYGVPRIPDESNQTNTQEELNEVKDSLRSQYLRTQ